MRNNVKTQKLFAKNAAYQKFEVLKTNRNKRYKYHEFIVEGVRNINEAVKNGWQIHSFIYSSEKPLSSWAINLLKTVETQINYELTADLMSDLSDKMDTSELLAIIGMKDDTKPEIKYSKTPMIALFDRPSNKGNLGTLLRSSDALGIEGLIITGHAVDVYDPDVISASMGSLFKVPFLRLSDNGAIDSYIFQLKDRFPDLQIIGTTAHHQTPLYDIDLKGPILLLIGNETDGLNRHLLELSDKLATIPMSPHASASSFNVSCAATVMFYEAARQRAKGAAGR